MLYRIPQLGDGPREALLLCLVLYVAGCHINGEDVACLATMDLFILDPNDEKAALDAIHSEYNMPHRV
jgi:hypothetical protein